MSPIFQSKPTSEELRRLAHDLLAIRASRFSSGDATLFDDETQNARILSDGALACSPHRQPTLTVDRAF